MTAQAIVLVGPMGAGKTSIGRRVARTVGLPFADTDKIVVRDHGPIPAIFAEYGEPYFRDLEREAVRSALADGGVVALGGGAILDASTRADLAAHRVILLTVSERTIGSRIGAAADRPLLSADEDPVARWTRIYAERRPFYDEVADVTFDTSIGRLQDVVEAISAWVRDTDPHKEQT